MEQFHDFHRTAGTAALPKVQRALLLHGVRQPYVTSTDTKIPDLNYDHELLIKVNAAGLNPIDWKAP